MKAKRRPKAGKGAVGPVPPSPEEIGKRAYEIFLARGGAPGREEEDWLQAERELLREWEKSDPV